MNIRAELKKIQKLLSIQEVGWCILGGIFKAVLAVCVPYLLGHFIDSIVSHGNILVPFLLLAGTSAMLMIGDFLLNRFLIRLARELEVFCQEELLKKFCQMSPCKAEQYRQGEIGMKFFRDIPSIGRLVRDVYPQFWGILFGFLFAIGAVFWSHWGIGLIFLVSLAIQVMVLIPSQSSFRKINHVYRVVANATYQCVFEFSHVFSFLKSMAEEDGYRQIAQRKLSRLAFFSEKKYTYGVVFNLLVRFLLFLSEYSVLGISGILAWQGKIPVGNIVFYQGLFLSVLNSFSGLFNLMPQLEEIHESCLSLDELFQNDFHEMNGNKEYMPVLMEKIEFRNVTFRYSNSEKWIFEDFSAMISAGSLVGIQGENGTGKTTFLKLATGCLTPDSGDVLFDDVSLSQISKASLRRQVGIVFQEFLLITGSIKNNITLYNPSYSEEVIRHAAMLSGIDIVAQKFLKKMDHRIGNNGGGLSGGERQKLAIARALIRNPRILILDEVTNHLDEVSKKEVCELLCSMKGKVTVLLVSHDPDIMRICDKFLVLQTRKGA